MKAILAFALASAAVLGSAGLASSAAAQPVSITFYDRPDYQGASVTYFRDSTDLAATGFAKRARSVRVQGNWRVCEGSDFRAHCEVLTTSVPDLRALKLDQTISSAERADGRAYTPQPAPPPPPPAYKPPPEPVRPPEPIRPPEPVRPPEPIRPPEPVRVPEPVRPPEPIRAPEPLPPSPPPPPPPPVAAAPPEPAHALPAPGSYDPVPLSAPAVPAGARYDPPPPAPEAAPLEVAENPIPDAAVRADQGVDGTNTIFFPHPTQGGVDIAADRGRAAQAFCKLRELGAAAYYDSEVSDQAVGSDGRIEHNVAALRDVLCRR